CSDWWSSARAVVSCPRSLSASALFHFDRRFHSRALSRSDSSAFSSLLMLSVITTVLPKIGRGTCLAGGHGGDRAPVLVLTDRPPTRADPLGRAARQRSDADPDPG